MRVYIVVILWIVGQGLKGDDGYFSRCEILLIMIKGQIFCLFYFGYFYIIYFMEFKYSCGERGVFGNYLN